MHTKPLFWVGKYFQTHRNTKMELRANSVLVILNHLLPAQTTKMRWSRRKKYSVYPVNDKRQHLLPADATVQQITWSKTCKNGGGFHFQVEWPDMEGKKTVKSNHLNYLDEMFARYCSDLRRQNFDVPRHYHASTDLEVHVDGRWRRLGHVFPNKVRMLIEPATSAWIANNQCCPASTPVVFIAPPLPPLPPVTLKPLPLPRVRSRTNQIQSFLSLPATPTPLISPVTSDNEEEEEECGGGGGGGPPADMDMMMFLDDDDLMDIQYPITAQEYETFDHISFFD